MFKARTVFVSVEDRRSFTAKISSRVDKEFPTVGYVVVRRVECFMYESFILI